MAVIKDHEVQGVGELRGKVEDIKNQIRKLGQEVSPTGLFGEADAVVLVRVTHQETTAFHRRPLALDADAGKTEVLTETSLVVTLTLKGSTDPMIKIMQSGTPDDIDSFGVKNPVFEVGSEVLLFLRRDKLGWGILGGRSGMLCADDSGQLYIQIYGHRWKKYLGVSLAEMLGRLRTIDQRKGWEPEVPGGGPSGRGELTGGDKHLDGPGRTIKLSELTWKDAAGYPAGVKIAELHSDAKAMISSAYIMIPAGTKVPAHTHPAAQWGTVVTGTMTFGLGTDPTKGTDVGPGDFVSVPAGTPHWLVAKTNCTIAVTAMGGPGMTYVNPTDDPRKAQAESH